MTKRKFIQYGLVDSDTIFLYFKVINDIQPKKVLDMGMLLKRAGALSRDIGNIEIDEGILLDGVDLLPEVDAGVYSTIYDHIFTTEDFLSEISSMSHCEGYDLIVAYDMVDLFDSVLFKDQKSIKNIAVYFKSSSSYLLTDSSTYDMISDYLPGCQWRTVKSGDKVSYLAVF
jgi:hypothetical protein